MDSGVGHGSIVVMGSVGNWAKASFSWPPSGPGCSYPVLGMGVRSRAKSRGPPPVRVHGGVRNPLKGWAREDGALVGTFSFQCAAVAGTCPVLEFGQVGQPGIAAEVEGALMTSLNPPPPATFELTA
jgi:hypothetical protein